MHLARAGRVGLKRKQNDPGFVIKRARYYKEGMYKGDVGHLPRSVHCATQSRTVDPSLMYF